MLNISGGELLIILLVALIFLGPERLPGVARQVGQTVNTLRGLARNFQAEIEAAAKPDPLTPPVARPNPTPSATPKAAEQGASADDGETSNGADTDDTRADASNGAVPATDVDALRDKARSNGVHTGDVKAVDDGGPVDLTDSPPELDEPTDDAAGSSDGAEPAPADGDSA